MRLPTKTIPDAIAKTNAIARKLITIPTAGDGIGDECGRHPGGLDGDGNSMVFEPQAGAEAPTRASGCLLEKGGKFLLAERTTEVVLELQGGDLEMQLGNQVEISGRALPASPGTPA